MTKKKYLLAAPGEDIGDSDPQDFFEAIYDISTSKQLGSLVYQEFNTSGQDDFQVFLIDHAFDIAEKNGWMVVEVRS